MDKLFKAFADKNRRKILTLLRDKEMTVNSILSYMEIGQATLSSHLAILKKAMLVKGRVDGKSRIYKLEKETLITFVRELNRFVNMGGAELKDEIIVRRETD